MRKIFGIGLHERVRTQASTCRLNALTVPAICDVAGPISPSDVSSDIALDQSALSVHEATSVARQNDTGLERAATLLIGDGKVMTCNGFECNTSRPLRRPVSESFFARGRPTNPARIPISSRGCQYKQAGDQVFAPSYKLGALFACNSCMKGIG